MKPNFCTVSSSFKEFALLDRVPSGGANWRSRGRREDMAAELATARHATL